MNERQTLSRGIHGRSARLSQMQFREWATLLLSFCVIGIIGLLAFTHVPPTQFSRLVSQVPMGETRLRTAAIVVQTDPDHCRQFTFDNDTGQIRGGKGQPCDGKFDPSAASIPEPVGTMHRLDAISKSFRGR